MAINTIEYSKVMMDQLDRHAITNLTSGWMEGNAGQVKYTGGSEIKIPTMSTVGLGKYDRDKGFVQGGVTVSYQTHTMTQDRGRSFLLDAMDVDESNFVATSANVIKVFQEEQVIPEIDAYRYSKIYSIASAASRVENLDLTTENVLSKLLEHLAAVEDEVGMEQKLIITLPRAVLSLLEQNDKFTKMLSVGDFKQGEVNLKIKKFNDYILRVVPSARLKTLYDIQDGKTGGQEAGGLKPNASAKDINWIICPENVPIAVSKTDKLRVFDPNTNQSADAWKIDYRKYHDLWIKKQKENQIFASAKA